MKATGLQRDDLMRFGRIVVRLAHRRLVTLRNTGEISQEEYEKLEELILRTITFDNVTLLLDSFEPRCNVQGAIDELIPVPNQLKDFRNASHRVRTALRALRGGDG